MNLKDLNELFIKAEIEFLKPESGKERNEVYAEQILTFLSEQEKFTNCKSDICLSAFNNKEESIAEILLKMENDHLRTEITALKSHINTDPLDPTARDLLFKECERLGADLSVIKNDNTAVKILTSEINRLETSKLVPGSIVYTLYREKITKCKIHCMYEKEVNLELMIGVNYIITRPKSLVYSSIEECRRLLPVAAAGSTDDDS